MQNVIEKGPERTWDESKNKLTLTPVTVTEKSLNFSAGPFESYLRSNTVKVYNSPFQRQIQHHNLNEQEQINAKQW